MTVHIQHTSIQPIMLLTVLLLSLISLAHACTLPHYVSPNLNTTTLSKRWYGVDHLTEETQYNRGPWPESYRDDGTTPIRFCFDDEDSYTNLLSLVQDAINI